MYSWSQFYQHICVNFFAPTRCEAFFGEWHLENGKLIWRISPYILGKFHQRRKLMKLNGKLFAQHCVLATFYLAHKGW